MTLGLGHAYRCLALADALHAEGWDVLFVMNEGASSLIHIPFNVKKVPSKKNSEFDESKFLCELGYSVDLLVIDHYERGEIFESLSRTWARKIFVIDDLANRKHDCDYLLDQTVGRVSDDYKGLVPANCITLTGSAFAILRTEFAKARFFQSMYFFLDKRPIIVISLGGTDPRNLTAQVLNELVAVNIHRVATIEVIGGAVVDLRNFADVDLKIHRNVSNMAGILSRADVAIGAGGVGALERCCLGLPTLTLTTAANQRANINGLIQAKAVLHLGEVEAVPEGAIGSAISRLLKNTRCLQQIQIASRAVCDGLGTWRVLDNIDAYKTATGELVSFVDATMDHAELIFNWQNEINARVFSRNPSPPSHETHIIWMDTVLRSTKSHLSIIMIGTEQCGVIRVDADASSVKFEVSILLAAQFRSRGIGKVALKVLIRRFSWAQLCAEIHPNNKASVAMFTQCGFLQVTDTKYIREPDAPQP